MLRSWSTLTFLRRIPIPVRLAVNAAAKTDLEVELLMQELLAADCPRNDDPTLRAGFDALITKGLLTAEQKAAILDL